MSEWQPIESAPKNWVPVLVWAYGESEEEDANDEDREPTYSAMVARHSDVQPGHWWLCGTMHFVYNPTHWMPLPAPPTTPNTNLGEQG